MPYTDWNYTNPGWTNENPPAINESNLNDISDFLTKFDYYIWKRQKIELNTPTHITGEEDVYITQNKNAYTEGLHDGYLYTYLGTPMDNIVNGVQIIQYIGNGQKTVSFGVPENFKAIFYVNAVVCSPIIKGLSQFKAVTSNIVSTFNYTISNNVLEISGIAQGRVNDAGILYSLVCIK